MGRSTAYVYAVYTSLLPPKITSSVNFDYEKKKTILLKKYKAMGDHHLLYSEEVHDANLLFFF